ncbi:uncharacterized protein BJ171DRAFT_565028 [Polychytrium aggregatum]|uniref:uncharacterized protein n=1 Tax=Polychytrium aggregatum TaxID=110093 RepID=UPI0022FE3999|nr:uncharacterized protein BJ171DRAFT_565028 [Polychytrium aggregatum]KAI9208484.1 hypothetical protein BJ171DRAFT_565028 [Polychytrium aggregatum]
MTSIEQLPPLRPSAKPPSETAPVTKSPRNHPGAYVSPKAASGAAATRAAGGTAADGAAAGAAKGGSVGDTASFLANRPPIQRMRTNKHLKGEIVESFGNLIGAPAHKHLSPSSSTLEYRHYVPFHPTCNKLLAKRWDRAARDLHLAKLRHARPTIDNAPPKVYPHLEMRLKRLQIQEERLHDIERKNHNLLDRIAFQMVNPSEVSGLDASRRYSTAPCPGGQGPPGEGSLHAPKRRRDMMQIAVENLTILQRLEEKAPYYNRLEWLAQRHKNLGYLLNIAQYPGTYRQLVDESNAYQCPVPPKLRGITRGMQFHRKGNGAYANGRPITRPSKSGGKGPLEEYSERSESNASDHSLSPAVLPPIQSVHSDADPHGFEARAAEHGHDYHEDGYTPLPDSYSEADYHDEHFYASQQHEDRYETPEPYPAPEEHHDEASPMPAQPGESAAQPGESTAQPQPELAPSHAEPLEHQVAAGETLPRNEHHDEYALYDIHNDAHQPDGPPVALDDSNQQEDQRNLDQHGDQDHSEYQQTKPYHEEYHEVESQAPQSAAADQDKLEHEHEHEHEHAVGEATQTSVSENPYETTDIEPEQAVVEPVVVHDGSDPDHTEAREGESGASEPHAISTGVEHVYGAEPAHDSELANEPENAHGDGSELLDTEPAHHKPASGADVKAASSHISDSPIVEQARNDQETAPADKALEAPMQHDEPIDKDTTATESMVDPSQIGTGGESVSYDEPDQNQDPAAEVDADTNTEHVSAELASAQVTHEDVNESDNTVDPSDPAPESTEAPHEQPFEVETESEVHQVNAAAEAAEDLTGSAGQEPGTDESVETAAAAEEVPIAQDEQAVQVEPAVGADPAAEPEQSAGIELGQDESSVEPAAEVQNDTDAQARELVEETAQGEQADVQQYLDEALVDGSANETNETVTEAGVEPAADLAVEPVAVEPVAVEPVAVEAEPTETSIAESPDEPTTQVEPAESAEAPQSTEAAEPSEPAEQVPIEQPGAAEYEEPEPAESSEPVEPSESIVPSQHEAQTQDEAGEQTQAPGPNRELTHDQPHESDTQGHDESSSGNNPADVAAALSEAPEPVDLEPSPDQDEHQNSTEATTQPEEALQTDAVASADDLGESGEPPRE